MAVSTNFLLFNEANKEIDTMNDSEYQGAAMRRNGVASGIADRRLHNKFYRQASIVSKALADFIVSHGYNASDADLDVFRTNLENALNHLSNSGIGSHNVSTSAHSNLFSSFRQTSNGLYVPKTGGTISGNVTVTGSTTTGTLTVGGASTLKGNVGVTGDVSASGYVYSATPAQTDNSTKSATTEFVKNAVSALVNSSPAALDTLKELATALGNDPNFATTMTNALATKAPLASPALTGNPTAPTQLQSDNSTKIATTAYVRTAVSPLATSASLSSLTNDKFKAVSASGPTLTFTKGDNTTVSATVNNVSYASSAGSATNATSATNASYTTTQSQTDNSTKIASTAFVKSAISALVNSSPAALDTLKELATALGNDPNFATTMTNALATKAPLASPALTGTPTAPTASTSTNTSQIATTAFVQSLIKTLKSSNITDFFQAAQAAATARITGDVSNANSWWIGIPAPFGTICIQGGEAVYSTSIGLFVARYPIQPTNFISIIALGSDDQNSDTDVFSLNQTYRYKLNSIANTNSNAYFFKGKNGNKISFGSINWIGITIINI